MPPRSGGYAQKTMLVGIRASDDEDPQGIHYYSRANLSSRKRPPCFLILAGVPAGGRSRAPSPPRVRVSLSVVLGQSSLRVAGDANSLTPNNQDAHPSGSRDLRATMMNGYFFTMDFAKHNQRLLCMGFCLWAKALYAQKPPLITNR